MGPFLGERVDRRIDILPVFVFLVRPGRRITNISLPIASFEFSLGQNFSILVMHTLITRRNVGCHISYDLDIPNSTFATFVDTVDNLGVVVVSIFV